MKTVPSWPSRNDFQTSPGDLCGAGFRPSGTGQNADDKFRTERPHHRDRLAAFRSVSFPVNPIKKKILLSRVYPAFPTSRRSGKRDQRCYEAYNIQVQGLAKRLKASGIHYVVIGISGGLIHHALIVAARTMDLLKLPGRISWPIPCRLCHHRQDLYQRPPINGGAGR